MATKSNENMTSDNDIIETAELLGYQFGQMCASTPCADGTIDSSNDMPYADYQYINDMYDNITNEDWKATYKAYDEAFKKGYSEIKI